MAMPPGCGTGIDWMFLVQALTHRVTLDDLSAIPFRYNLALGCNLDLAEDVQTFLFFFPHAYSVECSPHLDYK
jgi:hypothetical protein